LVACLTSGARVLAAEEPEALIRQGLEMRRQGKDAKAYGYFKRAYELAHTPRSAAQLGFVEQALEQFLEAEGHLAEALATRDPWVQQHRAVLEESASKVRSRLGRIEIRGAPAGATVEMAGREAIAVPADGVVWVAPGGAALKIAAPGHQPAVRQVTVAAGASVTLDAQLAPTAPTTTTTVTGGSTGSIGGGGADIRRTPEPPPSPSSRTRPARIAGLAVGGAGVALAVAGIFVYRSGLSKRDAIEQAARQGMPYDDANGNYHTLGNVGVGLMVGGAAALATGAVLYFLNGEF
jgi:hypothetical protein